jgi:hypothetical protein
MTAGLGSVTRPGRHATDDWTAKPAMAGIPQVLRRRQRLPQYARATRSAGHLAHLAHKTGTMWISRSPTVEFTMTTRDPPIWGRLLA